MGLQYSPRSTGSGNATVPNDASIQPPQAFVDYYKDTFGYFGNPLTGYLDLPNKGITHFDGNLLYNQTFGIGYYILQASVETSLEVDLSGNALGVSSINGILAAAVNYETDAPGHNPELNLSGGTNAAPTGQGITDKNTLIANGWTVTTN